MTLNLDIAFFLPLLMGGFLGGVVAWFARTRIAKQEAAQLAESHVDSVSEERQSLGQLHTAQIEALTGKNRELKESLDSALAEAANGRNEINRLINDSRDQIRLLEQRNNELLVRLDMLAVQTEQLRVDRDQKSQQYSEHLQAQELRHADQLEKVESPLTVVVHPFVNTEVDEGFIKSTTTVEVGYKYQLMIQGIPCMEPHDVVVERQTKVKVDEQALKVWGEKALALAEAAIQLKGGAAASSLISVAKTVILGRK